MARRDEMKGDDDPTVDRLDYADASARANELRADAEQILEQLDTELEREGFELTGASAGVTALGLLRVLVLGVLEVGARLELLELDAELAREEVPE